MADVTNNTLNAYFKNRVKYHAASRLASQTGEGLAQALNVDGHIVTFDKVWTAPATQFPNNADKANVDPVDATNDLMTVFKAGATAQTFWNGGKVWTNPSFPAVKLYEDIPMTPVKGSDGGGKFQSFEVLAAADGISSGTIRLVDWAAPTAVADRETGKPVAGFSGIYKYGATLAAAKAVQAASTSKWAATLGTWEFVYMAGLLQFEPGYTPQDVAAAAVNATTGKTYLYLTAFKYCGEYLSETLEGLTVQAGAKEIATVNAVFNTDNTISGVLEGLSGTITEGKVNVFMPANCEIINVKEDDGDAISPDIDYATSGINVYADYASGTLPSAWVITYRV